MQQNTQLNRQEIQAQAKQILVSVRRQNLPQALCCKGSYFWGFLKKSSKSLNDG